MKSKVLIIDVIKLIDKISLYDTNDLKEKSVKSFIDDFKLENGIDNNKYRWFIQSQTTIIDSNANDYKDDFIYLTRKHYSFDELMFSHNIETDECVIGGLMSNIIRLSVDWDNLVVDKTFKLIFENF